MAGLSGSSFAIAGYRPLTWGVCLVGTGYLFYDVPKSFLPVGDSSFIRGVLVAQEGTSPEQMHAYQTQAENIMQRQSRCAEHLHHERQQFIFADRTRRF